MNVRNGYTLAEMIMVVLVLAVIAALATPRLHFGQIQERQAEVTAWKIVADLRRTRSLAILEAASNPDGFALEIKQTDHGATYEIVNSGNKDIVDTHAVDSNVGFSGRMKFEFDSLGVLKEKNDPSVHVSAGEKTFTIRVIPTTGMVKCDAG